MQEKSKKRNKSTLVLTLIAVITIIGIWVVVYAQFNMPYAITANDNEIVLVKDKASGEKVVKKIMQGYAADDSKITSIELDKDLTLEQKKIWENVDSAKVLTNAEAVDTIQDTNADGKASFVATIKGKTKTEETYTPEIKYVKDDELFAGESEQEGKTVEGTKLVTREIVTENGEIVEQNVTNEKIIDEGETTIIHKGTRGLPEGEDWKTFEGTPVFSEADDLMDYSVRFVGRPYVRGGTSLVTGVDCVGFVRAIYKFHGISLSSHLKSEGHSVSYSNVKKGDILCFSHHYALYLGNGKMIHAANPSKDVCIEKVHGGIIAVRRIID